MSDDDQPRETTAMRRMSATLGGDKLHKGINWTTFVGVIATAALGYFADQERGKGNDKLAEGAAREITALQTWKEGAQEQLASQAEQVARLREAVAALRAVNETMAQGYGAGRGGARVRAAVEDVGELLAAPAPVARPASAEPDRGRVQSLKSLFLGD